MQYKDLNTYTITHKSGQTERVNAETMIQALQNMKTPEEESPVMRALTTTQIPIRTVVDDLPAEIMFSAVVSEESLGGGNIATPTQGTVHVGDEIQLEAIPARNWEFVKWERNGRCISHEASFLYTMKDLVEGEDVAVFTAVFKLSDIEWTTAVAPAEATGEGCIAFPTQGTTAAEGYQEYLAVPKEGWVFDHWERNAQEVGSNALLQIEHLQPKAEDELDVVYTAVFVQG